MLKLYVYYEGFDGKLCCSEIQVSYEEAKDAIKHYKTGGRMVITVPASQHPLIQSVYLRLHLYGAVEDTLNESEYQGN